MCELESEQKRLIQSVETTFSDFRSDVNQMDCEVLAMSEKVSDSSRMAVHDAWSFTAIVGLLCAGNFVLLARSIVRKISDQFTTILECIAT